MWNDVKAALKKQIPSHSYRMWIEPLKAQAVDDHQLVLLAPNFFSRKRVLDQYGATIESLVKRIANGERQLVVEIANVRSADDPPLRDDPWQMPIPEIQARTSSGRMLRKDFTFDQFVVGGNNDFAYSASLSLASTKSNHQSSLFLLARSGMGKSHLAQAVGHHILSHTPKRKVFYITAEDFTNEMIQAFRQDSLATFQDRYRNGCDVLLLEDIHYLSGKARTQVELAHTIDTLAESGKKIIFSSCYTPSAIPKLDDTLRSRFGSGLMSAIEAPDFRTRIRILNKKAIAMGRRLPADVVEYLASELTDDVRQLESGLIGITAKSDLLSVPIDMNLAREVVGTLATQRKTITIDIIKQLVSQQYQISLRDLISKSRRQNIVRPRQVAIYLSRQYTDAPLQTIGKSFNRYHATAMHSINVVERELTSGGPLRRQVDLLCTKLDEGTY